MAKGFNCYLEGFDTAALRNFLIRNGILQTYQRDDYFSRAGIPTRHVAYVEEGVFRHVCTNRSENKMYSTGFAFAGEFVADYPACIYGWPAQTDIQAVNRCRVYICDADKLQSDYWTGTAGMCQALQTAEQLFFQLYNTYLDVYRETPEERYRNLLRRCPGLLQELTLKEVASYLKITPTTLSSIRRRITFG